MITLVAVTSGIDDRHERWVRDAALPACGEFDPQHTLRRVLRFRCLHERMAEDYAIYRLYIDGVPFEFHSADSATKTYADLCDVVAKAHSDRKARHFSFSTSSHPTKGRSIDVLVTASTRVMLDAPLGW